MDYYEILEINKGASEDVIKAAYKALAKKYHPDNNKMNSELCEEKLKQLNEAYEVLSDSEIRKRYDESIKYSATQEENPYTAAQNENPVPEPPKKKSFWRSMGEGFLSYLEKQNQEMENAYYRGLELSENALIQEFKCAKGAKRFGYARAMEQKGLLEKDKDDKYVPTSKFYYYR